MSKKIDTYYFGKLTDDLFGPVVTTHDVLIGKVRCQWNDDSERSRFTIAKRLTFGPDFPSVEEWKAFLEIYLEKVEEIGEPKTMNKLIKVLNAVKEAGKGERG